MSTTIETLKNSNGGMLALAAFAFLITAVLVFFIIRMLVGGRLRMPGGRARQARLGIVDAFDLDRQRQLILVRRDNTEHLIMIGGPNDLLIESEIVRVEARDLRRDKAPEFMGGSSDGRIPAPFAQPVDRADADGSAVDPAATVIPPEPTVPLTLPVLNPRSDEPPVDAGAPVDPAAPRTPTFPLPPRRPATPERRVPPRLPEPVRPAARVDPPLMDGGLPPRPIVDVPAEPRMDAPVAVDAAPSMPTPSMPTPLMPTPLMPAPAVSTPAPPPLVAPAPATPRATPPSFLKPLPPRPPIRPLVRSNPRPPGTSGEPLPPSANPAPSASPPAPPVAAPIMVAPLLAPVTKTEAAPASDTGVKDLEPKDAVSKDAGLKDAGLKDADFKDADSKDALESLEEEMAKLLGRGPGG